MNRGEEWYARRKQEKILKPDDRIAVLGRGIAIVAQVNGEHVQAALWNRAVLRIRRTEIVWDEQNLRWESHPSFPDEQKMKSSSFASTAP